LVLVEIARAFLIKYPVPANITYFWNFGFLAGMCLVVQVFTGIFLGMHYTPHVVYSFLSVEHIMRDVNNGWLLRYSHSNGASMFFIVVYTHVLRGVYYGSYLYPRELLWCSGVLILLLMIVTAFMGYVLPWGQMSFRGATVITNLFSAIPKVGIFVVNWIWGAFSIENATLNRFFSLHFFFPFLLLGLVIVHLLLLHDNGSNNPLGIGFFTDEVPFHPYFIVKDGYGMVVFFVLFSVVVGFYPNVMGHPDNYVVANPLVTPVHIVPEWYFLVFHAISRSIPDKLGGVLGLLSSIVILLGLPFLWSLYCLSRSMLFKPLPFFFWGFAINCLILGWIGSCPVEFPYLNIGVVSTIVFFIWFGLFSVQFVIL
jgi:quinol-cytochrome oxidoreductase complex cytochrome b subunit